MASHWVVKLSRPGGASAGAKLGERSSPTTITKVARTREGAREGGPLLAIENFFKQLNADHDEFEDWNIEVRLTTEAFYNDFCRNNSC